MSGPTSVQTLAVPLSLNLQLSLSFSTSSLSLSCRRETISESGKRAHIAVRAVGEDEQARGKRRAVRTVESSS